MKEPEQEILEELKAEPKREKTDLTDKDRTRLIIEAWNAVRGSPLPDNPQADTLASDGIRDPRQEA